MRKLIESTLVSLDGIIGSPDRWAPFDEESRQLAKEELERYDALVLGRVTYEFFRANWGAPTGDPYIDQINAIPKYVASRTLSEVRWNATLLGPDIVHAIEQLKAQPGKDLFKMGTSHVDDISCRAPRRRAPSVGHAGSSRLRPAPIRTRRYLVAQARAHRRPQARQQLGHPHLHGQLTIRPLDARPGSEARASDHPHRRTPVRPVRRGVSG
jgi:RibD C-terminal domain